MLTAIQTKNIKSSQIVEEDLTSVVLILGENRSTKSALMDGIALAATGRCAEIGLRTAPKLISKGKDSAAALAFFRNGTTCGWQVHKKGEGYKSTHVINDVAGNDLPHSQIFGDFLYIDDFWALTGEAKWDAIGKLLSANMPEDQQSALTELYTFGGLKSGAQSDPIADLATITDTIAAKIKSLKASRKVTQDSLTPPEPYEGESIGQMQCRKAKLDAFITEQRLARKGLAERQLLQVKRACSIKETEQSLHNHRQQLESAKKKAESVRLTLEAITPLAEAVRLSLANDVSITKLCRSSSVREVMGLLANNTAAQFNEALAVIEQHVPKFTLRFSVQSVAKQLSELAFALSTCEDDIDTRIAPPDEVVEIDSLLASSLVKWRPTDLEGYATADAAVREDLHCLEGICGRWSEGIHSLEANLAKQVAANEMDTAKYGEPCPEPELLTAIKDQEQLTKQINDAGEWDRFLAKQRAALKQIDILDSDIAKYEGMEGKARKLRADLLNAAISPLELSANEFLKTLDLGLEPLRIKITCTAKRSSLTIETTSGVDFATMAGSEKVLYGTALVSSMQQLSQATSPLLLIEAAECDADILTALLATLSVRVIKGNAIVAHWCAPSCIPPNVDIIDRSKSKEVSC